jgi:hypothetical protein
METIATASSEVKGRPARRRFPATHSEKTAVAVLRTDWSETCERLTIYYPGQSVSLELVCDGRPLLSGAWKCEVCRNGSPCVALTAWESTCWVSDEDVDYLELEIKLAGGLRVQRHVALARQDRFLLLADAVFSDGERTESSAQRRTADFGGSVPHDAPAPGCTPGTLEYRCTLPLDPGVSFHGAKDSREGFLQAVRKRLALVLPLALPEWRSDSRVGELSTSTQGLELRQAIAGRGLFAPLFIDLDPRRLRGRFTWRPLTVAESLVIQPPDVAAGYRVAIGKQQWLIYRSLGPKGNRTLLGHNLSTETLIARFQRTGEVESIIEIE